MLCGTPSEDFISQITLRQAVVCNTEGELLLLSPLYPGRKDLCLSRGTATVYAVEPRADNPHLEATGIAEPR